MEMDLAKQELDMLSGENNKILVAVWMVTYNHADYIEQAVESVMNQKTNFNCKLYIGEDCSTDNTCEICLRLKEKYSDKIELVINSQNIGASQNAIKIFHLCFNSGAKYIAMLEGDDYWSDSFKLQKQVDFLEANPEYVLTFHPVQILKPDGSLVGDFITTAPENYETQETLARLGNYIHTPSVVFRNIIKSFPPEFALSPIGDYFLYMILTNHGKIKMLENEMAVYRYNVGIFSGKSKIKKAKDSFKLFSLLMSYSDNNQINQIFLERQMGGVDYLENLMRAEYGGTFVSNHIFFRAIKAIQQPTTMWQKINSRFK